jgi:hypothetical protein
VTLQRLGVRRVDHRDLGEVLLGKCVIHRVGVDPAGLHHHVRHPAAAQLAAHRLEQGSGVFRSYLVLSGM